MTIPKLKLKSQLAIINAFSKVLIIGIAIFVIPVFVKNVAIKETDNQLYNKLDQLYNIIREKGLEQFVGTEDNERDYGSYNILKEEFISIESSNDTILFETIGNVVRIIEDTEYDYRVVSANMQYGEEYYLVEIGKSISSIIIFEKKLKSFAIYFLLILFGLSILLDLSLTQVLLKPFDQIIQKLKNTRHPTSFNYSKTKTHTSDFNYLEESIHQLMKRIEKAFVSEREFIGNISHELLTPISIIRSKLDNFINNTALTDDELKRIYDSRTSLLRLTKMVRSLLLMSRIENKEYILQEKIDIISLVQDVVNEVQDRAEIKDLSLKLKIEIKEKFIKGNRELIHILFLNLLNNAIKYTENGQISLSVIFENNKTIIKISDTGIGIAKEQLAYIFNRHKKFNANKNSFGLGLAIVKKICDYHSLQIEVKSKLNIGTTVTIYV